MRKVYLMYSNLGIKAFSSRKAALKLKEVFPEIKFNLIELEVQNIKSYLRCQNQ